MSVLADRQEQRFASTPLMSALVQTESSGNPSAVSPAGAVGLTQLMPDTARELGLRVDDEVDERLDPELNLQAGSRYLEQMFQRYKDPQLALMAYHSGPGNVDNWIAEGRPDTSKGIGPLTWQYVDKLLPVAMETLTLGDMYDESAEPVYTPKEVFRSRRMEAPDEVGEDYFTRFKQAPDTETEAEDDVPYPPFMLEADRELVEKIDRTVGQPFLRGWQNFLSQSSSALGFLDYYASYARNGFSEVLGENVTLAEYDSLLNKASRGLMRSAMNIDPDPSTIPQAEKWYEWLEPDRIYQTFAEGVPTMAALISATLVSRGAGIALAGSLYGGQALDRMHEWEQETGEQIDPTYKFAAPIIVGAFSGALQSVGIDKILRAAHVPGLKNRLLNILIAGATEGSVEAGQELAQVIAEVPYMGSVDPDAGRRLFENFYAGVILGLGSSTATAGIGKYAEWQNPPKDAELLSSEFVTREDGTLAPMFLVTRPGHPMQGQKVTIEQMQENQLTLPEFRVEALTQMLERLETPQEVVDATLAVVHGRANELGITAEEFVDNYIHGVVKADRIRKGDRVLAPDMLQDHVTYRDWQSIIETLQEPRNQQILTEEGVRPRGDRTLDQWVYEALNNLSARKVFTSRQRSWLQRRYNDIGEFSAERIGEMNRIKQNVEMDLRRLPYRPDTVVRFTEEGKMLIGLLNGSKHRGVLQALGEVMLTTAKRESLAEMEAVIGVKDGNWKDVHKRRFGQLFENYVAQGKSNVPRMDPYFEAVGEYLRGVYGKLLGAGEATVHMPVEAVSFFNKLFSMPIARIPDQPTGWRRITAKLVDALDVEGFFRRFGAPETGKAVKRKWSVEDFYINEGVHVTRRVGRLLKSNKERMLESLLIAESKSETEALMKSKKAADKPMKDAVGIIRRYFDQSAGQLKYVGALRKTFQEHLQDAIQERIAEAKRSKDTDALLALIEDINALADIEFVHIPLPRAFFMTRMKDGSPQALQKIIKGLVDQKRKTLTLRNIIEDGVLKKHDVQFADVMASYASRKANDMSLYEIKRAAIREGAAVRNIDMDSKAAVGYKSPPPGAAIFKGFHLNPALHQWLVETGQLARQSTFKKIMNTAKLYAFYNPLFLPMYDLLQSTMAGALNPMRPIRSARLLKEAWQDVNNFSPEYIQGSLAGRDSKPFAPPYHTRKADFIQASNSYPIPWIGRYGYLMSQDFAKIGKKQGMDVVPQKAGAKTDIVQGFKATTMLPLRLLQTVYKMSWDTAWTLDSWVRQATFRDGLDRGMSVEMAAQRAATAHADYASVPAHTRSRLNKIFFTPTFKIAMGKFLVDSLNNAAQVVAGQTSPNVRIKAGTLMRTMAIMMAFDVFLRSLGFEREEFGRTYKQPVDTDIGPRELAVTWSGPHNLFLKYYQRLVNSFGPEVPNNVQRFFQLNKWELHPFWRVANDVVSNKGSDGEPIFFVFDSPEIKMMESARYIFESLIPMYTAVLGEDLGEQGRELLAQEHGQLMGLVSRPFWFAYERQPEALRKANTIRSMIRQMEEEVGIRGLQRRILRGDRPADIEEFMEGADRRAKKFASQLTKYIDRSRRELYSPEAVMEAFNAQRPLQ